MRPHALEQRALANRILVAALGGLRGAIDRLVDGLQIRERELRVDDVDVRDRIDLAGHVHDVRALEAAHDVRDRIGLADVRQELVAEPFALRRASDEPRDIDELHRRRQDLLRLHDRRELLEPLIRHRHHADVRIDRAERIVLRRDLRARQRIEQRGLADVGQARRCRT